MKKVRLGRARTGVQERCCEGYIVRIIGELPCRVAHVVRSDGTVWDIDLSLFDSVKVVK